MFDLYLIVIGLINKNDNPNQMSACENNKKYNKGHKDIPTFECIAKNSYLPQCRFVSHKTSWN